MADRPAEMATAPSPRFDASDLRLRLRERAGHAPAHRAGDHVLNPDLRQLVERPGARAAAVLVAVVDRPQGAGVILTTRARTLRKHSGQIAFPGGSIDPQDASPEAAALREAQEEIALDPAFVETLGRLPVYLSGSGFAITPVLAIVRPGFRLVPDPAEVEDVFEVPLGFLMDEANHVRESRVWEGAERHYYVMPFGSRFIWGVTAGILRTLFERYYA